jgi:copper chaperone CopZ
MHPTFRAMLAPAILLAAVLGGCEYCLVERSPEAERLLHDDTVLTRSPAQIQVMGMSCPKCVSNVDIQLMRVPGVNRAAIDMSTGIVRVEFDPSRGITRAALAKAVDDSGLTVTSIQEG